MKKYILSMLCLATAQANAQSTQFYAQLNGGGHIAKQIYSKGWSGFDYGFGPGFSGGLSLGATKGKWLAEAGLSYIQHTAKNTKDLKFEDQLDPITGQVIPGSSDYTMHEKYSHIMLPVRVGYQVMNRGKLRILPVVGVGVSYNLSYKTKSEGERFPDAKYKEMPYLGNEMSRLSVWGSGGAELQFLFNKHTSLIVNPEASYMLTPFNNVGPRKQHSLMLGINAGFRWIL